MKRTILFLLCVMQSGAAEVPTIPLPKPPRLPSVKDSFYELLSITPSATQEDIEGRYARISTDWSRRTAQPSAKDLNWWKEVNDAYQVLRDPKKREAYDYRVGFRKKAASTETSQSFSRKSGEPIYRTPQFMQEDYYAVLDIAPTASQKEIKDKYEEYVLSFPYIDDNTPRAEAALIEKAFTALIRAYDTLSDPAARAHYDAQRTKNME